mgnify:CR=1 FL=1
MRWKGPGLGAKTRRAFGGGAGAAFVDVSAAVFPTLAALFTNTAPLNLGQRVRVLEGGHRFQVVDAAAHRLDPAGNHLKVIPRSDGTISQFAFGAVGDLVADDTAPCQAAQDTGLAIDDAGASFLVSHLTVKSTVFAGRYLRKSGAEGHFLTIAAKNVFLNGEVDANRIGGAWKNAVHCDGFDGFRTGDDFVVRGSNNVGVVAQNTTDIDLRGRAYDCLNMGFHSVNFLVDAQRISFDLFVDNSGRETTCTNGGIKFHALNGAQILAATGHADVILFESVSMPANAVGIEFFGSNAETPGHSGDESFCLNVNITGTVQGGAIACTLHGCPDAYAVVQAVGPQNLGLELTAGSAGATFAAGSTVSNGVSVKPKFAVTATGGCNGAVLDVVVQDVDPLREPQAASFYVHGSANVTIKGATTQSAGKRYVRVYASPGLKVLGLSATGAATAAFTLDTAPCDDLLVEDCIFQSIARPIDAYGTFARATFRRTDFQNTGALVGGSATLTEFTTEDCTFATHLFGAALSKLDLPDLQPVWSQSKIKGEMNGSPAGLIEGAVGSICTDTSTGLVYAKTGTTKADWQLQAA